MNAQRLIDFVPLVVLADCAIALVLAGFATWRLSALLRLLERGHSAVWRELTQSSQSKRLRIFRFLTNREFERLNDAHVSRAARVCYWSASFSLAFLICAALALVGWSIAGGLSQ